MSLPHLLLVDDSEAILAYEMAVLSSHYAISTANNGEEALRKAKEILPAGVLLDLSMPVMNGEEVLAQLRADPDTAHIPVVIISSERERGERCLASGAQAYLPKPIRADELASVVDRVLTTARWQQRQGHMAVLALNVGPLQVGISLENVHMVLHQVATSPLPLGPAHLCEVFDFRGEPVFVLDLARRFGVEHTAPLVERKLVVVRHDALLIALAVDGLRDPEEYGAEQVVGADTLGGIEHGALKEVLRGMVKTGQGLLPVIDPRALLSPALTRQLTAVVNDVHKRGELLRGSGEAPAATGSAMGLGMGE